jgi:hypothetical protein
MRFELSDFEWTAIKPMLPNKTRSVRRVNDRRVLNGIFWALAAAVLPVVLAVGTSIPGLSMPTLTLLCVYSLGPDEGDFTLRDRTRADVLQQRLYRQA